MVSSPGSPRSWPRWSPTSRSRACPWCCARSRPGTSRSRILNAHQPQAVGPVAIAFLAAVAVAVAMEWALHRSRWGRSIRAIGSDPAAAFRLGVRPGVTVIGAYVASALFACVGGVLLMAQIGVGDPTQGVNYTLASVTAVVLGGTSIFGGRGSFIGALFGAVLVEELLNVTTFLQLSQAWQYWFQGVLVMVAVGIYTQARARTGGLAQATDVTEQETTNARAGLPRARPGRGDRGRTTGARPRRGPRPVPGRRGLPLRPGTAGRALHHPDRLPDHPGPRVGRGGGRGRPGRGRPQAGRPGGRRVRGRPRRARPLRVLHLRRGGRVLRGPGRMAAQAPGRTSPSPRARWSSRSAWPTRRSGPASSTRATGSRCSAAARSACCRRWPRSAGTRP